MSNQTAETLVLELRELLDGTRNNPFPYEDCRRLLNQFPETQFQDLIPDLAMFDAEITGYCSWELKLLRWPEKQIREVFGKLGPDFFEHYPEYVDLHRFITRENTPSLFEFLALQEQMRGKLLNFLRAYCLKIDKFETERKT